MTQTEDLQSRIDSMRAEIARIKGNRFAEAARDDAGSKAWADVEKLDEQLRRLREGLRGPYWEGLAAEPNFASALADALEAISTLDNGEPGDGFSERQTFFDHTAATIRVHAIKVGEVMERCFEQYERDEAFSKARDIALFGRNYYKARDAQRRQREAAARTAATSRGLAEQFRKVSADERFYADIGRGLTLVVLGLICGLGWVYYGNPTMTFDANQVAVHIALVLPFAALATYLGRQSGQHRVVAREATQVAVRLDTLAAYVGDNPNANTDELWKDVNKLIFTKPDRIDDSKIAGVFGDFVDAATKIAKAATELAATTKDLLQGAKKDE